MLFIGSYGLFTDLADHNRFKKPVNVFSLFLNDTSGFPCVGILPSANEINYMDDSKNFDIALSNYILNNFNAFISFFENILYPIYCGYDVYIISSVDGEYYEKVIDSLLKFFQQRYGYNGAIIRSVDDYDACHFDEWFNITGIYNLDIDKERYTQVYAKTYSQIDGNGNPIIASFEGKANFNV